MKDPYKPPAIARAVEWFIDHMKLSFLPALTFSQFMTITGITMAVTVVNVLGWWFDWWDRNEVSSVCTFIFVLLMVTPMKPNPPTPPPPDYDMRLSHPENARRMLAWAKAHPHAASLSLSAETYVSLCEIAQMDRGKDDQPPG